MVASLALAVPLPLALSLDPSLVGSGCVDPASVSVIVDTSDPTGLVAGPATAVVESRPVLSKVQASASDTTTLMAIQGRMSLTP